MLKHFGDVAINKIQVGAPTLCHLREGLGERTRRERHGVEEGHQGPAAARAAAAREEGVRLSRVLRCAALRCARSAASLAPRSRLGHALRRLSAAYASALSIPGGTVGREEGSCAPLGASEGTADNAVSLCARLPLRHMSRPLLVAATASTLCLGVLLLAAVPPFGF